MSATLQQQLYEAEQRRQNALREQEAQAEALRAPAAAIAQAEAEIARLAQQQRQERFEQMAQVNTQAVNQVRDLTAQMIAQLNDGQVRLAIKTDAQIDAAWLAHKSAYLSAVNAVAADVHGGASARMAELPGSNHPYTSGVIVAQARYEYEHQLDKVGRSGYALMEWIAQAGRDAVERRVRIGLVYAATGELYNPSPGYNAEQAYASDCIAQSPYWS